MTKSTPPTASRQTRKAAAAQAAQSRLPTPVIALIVTLVILVAVVGLAVYNTIRDRAIATAPIEGVEQFPGQERGHTETAVTYEVVPPVGGQHNPTWQNCGVYDQAIQNETAVHSLEHGAVWVTYQPELSANQVEVLRSKVRGREYALLSPYPGQDAPVVASAWGLQLKLDDPNDERLERFLRKYMQGPQTPEPGAVCVSGVGTPIQR